MSFAENQHFDEATTKALLELPCCRPFEGKDLEYCCHCSISKIVPSDFIIQFFNEAGLMIDQVGRCNVHTVGYFANTCNPDPDDVGAFQFLPLQEHVEKVVIIRRTHSAS